MDHLVRNRDDGVELTPVTERHQGDAHDHEHTVERNQIAIKQAADKSSRKDRRTYPSRER